MINGVEDAFTLVIQRRLKDDAQHKEVGDSVQQRLPMMCEVDDERIDRERYVYRAIATNLDVLDGLDDSENVHWYNQRGEYSENRNREPKQDFAGCRMPCSDHQANAFYFALCAFAFNVFVLLRRLLPETLEGARVSTVRNRLFAMAGRITRHAHQVVLRMQHDHRILLDQLIGGFDRLLPVP